MYSVAFRYCIDSSFYPTPIVESVHYKLAKGAVGIPDFDTFGNLSEIPQYGESESLPIFIVSKHEAEKAGPHYDIRIGTPEVGLLSFATRKELPSIPGESIAVFQQPLHEYDYKDFSGEISSGYGKGYVHPAKQSPIAVHNVSSSNITFSLDIGTGTLRYSLVQDKKNPKRWYLINVSPNPNLPEKLKYRSINEDQARALIKLLGQTVSSVQPKIDGALGVVVIKDNRLEVFSHRISKRSGLPIVHTERIFGSIPKVADPNLDDTILLAEIYAVKKDPNGKERVLTPVEISALLNTKFYKALDKVKDAGIEWRFYVFDVVRQGKHDAHYAEWYNRPYDERVNFLRKILNNLPNNFHGPLEAKDVQSAEQLLATIKKHQHPLTEEGIVIFPERGVPYKHKMFQEGNFYIVGFKPGQGKYKGSAVGGILFSDRPDGPPLGVVGTGLDEDLRKEIFEDPDSFLGRKIRVKYTEKLPSGKLRNPVFQGFSD